MSIRVRRWTMGDVETNVYYIVNEEAGEGILIDPSEPTSRLSKAVTEYPVKPVAILLTHGHFDHIIGVDRFLESYPVPVYIGKNDQKVASSAHLNVSGSWSRDIEVKVGNTLEDGQVIELAGLSIRVIETPGHTQGGVCYYLEKQKMLFSGDTLFKGSCGRTDLPTGDSKTLKASILEKLFVLPDDVRVFPGHGDVTTIGEEKEGNIIYAF